MIPNIILAVWFGLNALAGMYYVGKGGHKTTKGDYAIGVIFNVAFLLWVFL